MRSPVQNTRPWTRRAFLGTLATGSLGLAYPFWIEPRWLEQRHVRLRLFSDPPARPLRLLHLSDIHWSESVPAALVEQAAALARDLAPDVICITGDFITKSLTDRASYLDILTRIAQTAPTYACPGNHDGGLWVAPHGGYADTSVVQAFLEEAGIRWLHNERQDLSVHGAALTLVGLGDLWAGECNPDRVADWDPTAGAPTVVLNHNPDAKTLLRPYRWDLMLSGHTHGGQIVLPLLGAPLAPVEDKRFVSGLHTWEGRTLHISRGIGSIRGIRFNCRPDLTLIEIT